ncbi:MAG: RNA 3'-terminal phosphate cyclase [Methanomassiliicoccales archaeon]|jgi:RNA 3'-phosphate cyclase|nr:RNA 3'-terminal phosphate cyclase [Methanomassiliicoccales archaeon]
MIEVDGSYGEGGGQLVRCAVAFAALTGKETRIHNIRAKRPNPGLAPQHLAAINGVALISGGALEGATIGSTEIIYRPGKVRGGKFRINVGTAGSIPLVLQACMLPAIVAETKTVMEITGGTNVRWSPPIDYYDLVLFSLLKRIGIDIEMEILARGFYPEGGGKVLVEISPAKRIAPLRLEDRGQLRRIGGRCFSQNLPSHICSRMCHSVKKSLIDFGNIDISSEISSGISTGVGICLFAEYENTMLGADALGEKGIPAETVGASAALSLKEEISSAGTLDIHASDQILPYLALAGEESTFRVRAISKHLETQLWLISKFMNTRFELEKIEGGYRIVVRPIRT